MLMMCAQRHCESWLNLARGCMFSLLRQVHGFTETCAVLGEVGLRNTNPFTEVTGGDLLELSQQELVNDFGVSRFQVCSWVYLAHCFLCNTGLQEKQPCAHGALRSQAKKVAIVQRAHALFNSMTASPGRAEVTVAELRVRTCFPAGRTCAMCCCGTWACMQ